jgi:hypothetical protein
MLFGVQFAISCVIAQLILIDSLINYDTGKGIMTDERSRIDGKFYPLQNDEWLQACQELKPAEVRVLYHLRTLDPFGEKELELGVSAIALRLGLSKGTVSKALKALNEKEWIDLELIKVKVKLRTRHSSTKKFPTGNTVSYRKRGFPQETQFPTGNSSFPQETPVSYRKQSAAETQSGQGSDLSKTYKTFKDSLSDSEREKFLGFVREQIKNLPKPVNDLEAWLASKNKAGENRWEVYYNNFLASLSNQTKVTPSSSSLHDEIEQRRAKIRENLAKNGH